MRPIVSPPGGIRDLPAPDRDVLMGRKAEEPGPGMLCEWEERPATRRLMLLQTVDSHTHGLM